MRVVIDSNRCAGHGRCYAAPTLFTDDERGYGVVCGDGELAPEQVRAAEAAVLACPEKAVELVDIVKMSRNEKGESSHVVVEQS
jgi:ferredoxin